jgi:hypothetical protein
MKLIILIYIDRTKKIVYPFEIGRQIYVFWHLARRHGRGGKFRKVQVVDISKFNFNYILESIRRSM